MHKILCRFRRDERGATAIEYSMIAALIGLVLIVVALNVGVELKGTFEGVETGLKKRVAVS